MRKLINAEQFLPLPPVRQVKRTATGALLDLGEEQCRIDVVRPDIVRVKISQGGVFDESPTFACVFPMPKKARFALTDSAATLSLRTPQLEVRVHKAPFGFDVLRADGSVVARACRNAAGEPESYRVLNSRFQVRRCCAPDDAFLGLGEKTGRLNRQGHSYILYNHDIYAGPADENKALPENAPERDPRSTECDPYYISIPFFYHLDGKAPGQPAAGCFIDNGYKGLFEFGGHSYSFEFRGGQYTEYFLAGPRLADVLEGYTWLTGRAAPPPLWALGYHQCRWHVYTQDSFLKLAAAYREKEIPCDVLWLDIDYMDGFRVFTWNRERFPDPQGLFRKLRRDGYRAITIIDPGVKYEAGYPVFDDGLKKNVFCKTAGGRVFTGTVWPGRTAFPDFVKPEARAWWGALNAAHVRSGLAGIWNDMNEPITFPHENVSLEDMRFDRDGEDHPHERYHNQYAMLMAMGTVEGLRQAMPELRTFVLSRAGFAGIQRYAANWMGDNASLWSHLWLSMPMALGLGLSGQPFVGADIGGFGGNSSPELLARWMQMGALTPFCRNHNAAGGADQYPWSFGPAVEAICRDALRLRYRLLPYLYAAFLRAAATGEPVQRPLVFDFQEDRTARDLDDQYLFGPALLVAPVYREGETRRPVYLPAGEWRDWYDGALYAGGRWVTAEAPLERTPLFVRAGAVIPMLPEAPASTMGLAPETLDLLVAVPEQDGTWESDLQEDDGLTFAFAKGACLRTRFTLTRRGRTLTLAAATEGQGFPEFRRRAFDVRLLGAMPAAATRDGKRCVTVAGVCRVPNRGESFALRVTLA